MREIENFNKKVYVYCLNHHGDPSVTKMIYVIS